MAGSHIAVLELVYIFDFLMGKLLLSSHKKSPFPHNKSYE
jgi:hypothetical protein